MTLDLLSPGEDHTIAIGDALGRVLRPGDVVCLHGELGAGKTCLVRGIARGLGLDGHQVSSPTFVVVHEYRPPLPLGPASGVTAEASAGSLFHVDGYRLHSADDLDTLGWDRVMDGTAPVVIEWPERIEPAGDGSAPSPLPARTSDRRADIRIEPTGVTDRRIRITAPPAWSLRPGAAALLRLGAGLEKDASQLQPGWVRCPVSGRPVPPDSPTFPFADEKCKLADLNRWFTGAYRVSREVEPDDLSDDGPVPGTRED